jgi:type I pantothenate kinase
MSSHERSKAQAVLKAVKRGSSIKHDEFWSPKNPDLLTSPFLTFTANEWSKFRADTPLTLSETEIKTLRSLNDPVSIEEVAKIYLSLSRLLSTHVDSSISLFKQRARFLALRGQKTPFIIGVAGSVAVGKSTVARILKELLARWPSSPKVELITTDGFLLPNSTLRRRRLMNRKGFPESYDFTALLRFLSAIKAGEPEVSAPLYSHLSYDVLKGESRKVERPDILIFEGINVLQSRDLPKAGMSVPFISDFFDFSIYIDADERDIERWYIDRFMRLRETAFTNPKSFFNRYSVLSEDAGYAIAQGLWDNINLINLHQNILPTRPRADLVLRKGPNHLIEHVALRKL